MDKITIDRLNYKLDIIKDRNIYEMFFQNKEIGWFSERRLNDAIKSITDTGFYDGKNYDMRIRDVLEYGYVC